jgi:hypothetical protein
MSTTESLDRVLAGVILAVVVGACTGTSNPPSPSQGSLTAATSPLSTPTMSPTPDRSPSPQPPSFEPSPSPDPIPPLTQEFRSPTMGYSVRYPKGWIVFNASEPWRAGQDERWDDPNGDRIESADAGFRGGSQPLAAGQSAKAWVDAYMATQVTWCGVREEIPLGGTQGTIGLNGCNGLGRLGGRVFDVVVVVGRRAYNFTMEGKVDHAFLLAMLATVEFDPASAVD